MNVTLQQWLDERKARVPEELVSSIEARLSEHLTNPINRNNLLSVIESEMNRLIASGSTDRASALDLLAIDAIVTYALQIDAENGVSLDDSEAAVISVVNRIASSIPHQ